MICMLISILIMYEVSLLLVLLPYSLLWPLLLVMLVVLHYCPLLTEYTTDVKTICSLKILFTERVVAKLSSTLMILVELGLLSSVRVKYRVQVRCLRGSETCEVSEVAICRNTSVIY